MASLSAPAVLESAAKIKATWVANPTFVLGELTLQAFTAAFDNVTQLEAAIDEKRRELQALLNDRDDRTRALQDLNTRALSGIRAVFGPDSSEYDQAGGTRRSERQTRRPAAKPKAS
jgi:hypothetical protein